MSEEAPLCNLCALSCVLGDEPCRAPHGLVDVSVSGGYESTPGNGHGALDDCQRYTFSLCEFCLDWLFSQFKIQAATDNYMTGEHEKPWRPAAQRVAEDEWRRMKPEFRAEYERRLVARGCRS